VTPGAGSPGPAEPGSGWPGDLATPLTPVAHGPAEVQQLAASAGGLDELVARQSVCRACPRLVSWREQVATAKRRSFQAEPYWGRPIPGWGDDRPGLLILGLAPAAHGGNRTGRIFTGDRSGDFLFASLYRCGLAASPESIRAGDGQRLIGARMVAAVRCAPPANKPTPAERDTCAPWLVAELAMVLPSLRVIVCLGGFAWQSVWPPLAAVGFAVPRPRPPFGHGAEVIAGHHGGQPEPGGPDALDTRHQPGSPQPGREVIAGHHGGQPEPGGPDAPGTRHQPGSLQPGRTVSVIGCYHPSQQNTFTGRVTPEMLDAVFLAAAERLRS
jgi:uracil-DNA glycosylase